MAPKKTLLISAVRKVAFHRRDDGEKLIRQGQYRGGMYIMGYAVECALKAYTGRHLGRDVRTLKEAEARYEARYGVRLDLTSVRAHNLRRLFAVAETLKLRIGTDKDLAQAKNRCLAWDYRWRYDPTPATRAEAYAFRDAVAQFHDWLLQRQ